MTSKVTEGHLLAQSGLNRLETVLGRDTEGENALFGVETPRIHTPLNDLPSLGLELVDLATSIGVEMMPWQKFALIHTHKVKPDGRWATPVNCIVVARQNGKSFLQQVRILGGLFLWKEPLQIGSAHRLATSLEQFRQLVSLIESNDSLSKQVKRSRWAHGAEEIETVHGTRFIVKAGGSAARGVSRPETMQELLVVMMTLVILNGLHPLTKSALKTPSGQIQQWASQFTLTICVPCSMTRLM